MQCDETLQKAPVEGSGNPPGLKPTPNLLNQMENLSNCPIILQLISNFHKFSQVSYLSS